MLLITLLSLKTHTAESESEEDPVNNIPHFEDGLTSNTATESQDEPANTFEKRARNLLNDESALKTRKSEFYSEVDKMMEAISQDQREKQIMSVD